MISRRRAQRNYGHGREGNGSLEWRNPLLRKVFMNAFILYGALERFVDEPFCEGGVMLRYGVPLRAKAG